ncbi:ribonuclease P [Candidatus Woesearchaeota archaeon]|nr:ribonuclease P [Candidatus Woesearchaeota archaeon]
MGKYQKKPQKQKEIARERIKVLFEQAKKTFRKDKKLSNRYIKLARELAMKFKIRIPSELKRRFCKHCYSYLMPGKNVRVRTREGKVVYYCLECKKYMRFPYLRERKAKRKK